MSLFVPDTMVKEPNVFLKELIKPRIAQENRKSGIIRGGSGLGDGDRNGKKWERSANVNFSLIDELKYYQKHDPPPKKKKNIKHWMWQ